MKRANPLACALIAIICHVPAINADIITFMDFTGFEDRLDDVATNAGIGLFSAAEKAQIKTGVISGLERAFQDFTVTFTESTAGGFNERMLFGLDTTAPGYGASSSDDFRNTSDFGIASIYTGKFAPAINTSVSRAQQIQELSFALSGTAAHELGHNFGLEHHDSYGTPGVVRSSGSVIDSGGLQNQNLMATGLTGLSIEERRVERTFSDLSLAKLEWSRGLTDNTPTSVFELTDNNDDFGTAQHVNIDQSLAISGFESANVIGTSSSGYLSTGETDFFSFDLLAGDLLTMELNSFDNEGTNFINGVLILYDSAMNQIGGINNTIYNDDLMGEALAGGDGSADPLFLNFEALNSGTYFAELRAFDDGVDPDGTGDYELLFLVDPAAMGPAAVPEPGSMALLGLCGVGFGYIRRKKTTSTLC